MVLPNVQLLSCIFLYLFSPTLSLLFLFYYVTLVCPSLQHRTLTLSQRMAPCLQPPVPALRALGRPTLPPWPLHLVAPPTATAPVTMLAPKQVSPTYINIYFNEISLSVRPLTFFTVVCAADSLLFNKIDERLRLARERREEREKQNGERSCAFDREKNKSYLFWVFFLSFPQHIVTELGW